MLPLTTLESGILFPKGFHTMQSGGAMGGSGWRHGPVSCANWCFLEWTVL